MKDFGWMDIAGKCSTLGAGKMKRKREREWQHEK